MLKTESLHNSQKNVIISCVEDAEKINPAMAIPERPRHNNPIGLPGTGERYRVTFEDEEGLKYYLMISSDEQEDYITGMQESITVDGDRVTSWSNRRTGRRALIRIRKVALMVLVVIVILLLCYLIASTAEKHFIDTTF